MKKRSPVLRLLAALLLGLSGTGLICQGTTPVGVTRAPYRFSSVAIVAGGFITGIVPHPSARGLFYARTDIGGAWRWDAAEARWIPLTDWVSAEQSNLLGIESIAVDPTNADKVYLAAGTYDRPGSSNGAILRSSDRGNTFQVVPMPFKMDGNQEGRFAGERLAVDPRHPSTLFPGTRNDGLWKSSDACNVRHRRDAVADERSHPGNKRKGDALDRRRQRH